MRNRKTEETGGQKVKKRTSQKEERQQQRRAPNRKSSPPPLAGSSVYPPRRPPATDRRRRRHVLRARRARAPLQHPQLVQGHPPPRLRPRAIPFLHPRPLVWHTLPDPRDLSDLLWCPHTAHPAKFARSNRAFCYSHLELHKHVVKDCDRALQLDPALLQAYVLKGLLPLMSLVYLSLFLLCGLD